MNHSTTSKVIVVDHDPRTVQFHLYALSDAGLDVDFVSGVDELLQTSERVHLRRHKEVLIVVGESVLGIGPCCEGSRHARPPLALMEFLRGCDAPVQLVVFVGACPEGTHRGLGSARIAATETAREIGAQLAALTCEFAAFSRTHVWNRTEYKPSVFVAAARALLGVGDVSARGRTSDALDLDEFATA